MSTVEYSKHHLLFQQGHSVMMHTLGIILYSHKAAIRHIPPSKESSFIIIVNSKFVFVNALNQTLGFVVEKSESNKASFIDSFIDSVIQSVSQSVSHNHRLDLTLDVTEVSSPNKPIKSLVTNLELSCSEMNS